MAEREPVPVPDDPRDWAPMRTYGGRARGRFEIIDPILEPFWSGTRVLAHIQIDPGAQPPATIALIEALGADLADELPAVVDALAEGVHALDAVVDGIITREVTLDGVGAAAIPEVSSRPTAMLMRGNIDFDVTARGAVEEAAAAAETEAIDGFVAVDLLRIDGSSLLEVPLLERLRLLESVIAPGPLLRLSPHVRPPIDPWIASWKSMGLRGGMLKAANSRYHPLDETVEWRVMERLNRRG